MNSFGDDLEPYKAPSQWRALRVAESVDGTRVVIDGKTVVNFSSNNYLNLATHPHVIAGARRALETWGAGAGASRLLSGSTALHQELEKKLAAFLGQDAALLFPSGYSTNVGVIPTLVGPGDAVILDRLSHASLVDGARLSGARIFVYPHGDPSGAAKGLERAKAYRRKLVVTESVYSMDGDIAPLRRLSDLIREHGAIGLLDEAHAVGVLGFHGRGVLGLEGMDDRWDVIVGTLSKAFGSQGGFVSGSQDLIDLIINRTRSFIYTTGLAPSSVGAALSALELIQGDPGPRNHVQRISNQLREGLRLQGWEVLQSSTHIIPIVLNSSERALACAEHMKASGLYAPAIRPPTVPEGESRLRFSVTAGHTEADVTSVLEALATFKQ